MNNDIKEYRNSLYCHELENVTDKKKELEKKIKDESPRLKNYYNKIRVKGSIENRKFLKIYNHKCAYCGNSIQFVDYTSGFEIDHFKNEASFTNKDDASKVENLVLSCYCCNRGKRGITLSEEALNLISPDNGNINKIFYRDKDYSIKIGRKHKGNAEIENFYEALRFNHEFRRLDYLLINMNGFCERVEDETIKGILAQVINILMKSNNDAYKLEKCEVK